MMREMFIVDGYRTPFCKFGTFLADEPVPQLGISPAKATFAAADVQPEDVDEILDQHIAQGKKVDRLEVPDELWG